jgi:putative hydrolase of the HAD superfamily
MGYAAVVFDLFGTLVPNWDLQVAAEFQRQVVALLGVEEAQLRARWMATGPARYRGEYPTLAANYAAVCGLSPQPPYSSEVLEVERIRLEIERGMLVPRAEDVQTLQRLRQAGLRIGMVSNSLPEIPSLWRESVLVDLIDAPVFSSELGIMKPAPAIYRAACEALGVEPAQCLYVGDGEHHELDGATAVGMTAVLLHRTERATQVHDPNANAWPGLVITTIPEVMHLVEQAPVAISD